MARKRTVDEGHRITERELSALEARVAREYIQADREIGKKLTTYFEQFAKQDDAMKKRLKNEEITEKAYQQWRADEMITGKQWQELREQIAKDYHELNTWAAGQSRETAAAVYAENINYGTYSVEKLSKINTSFTLYNKDAVKNLLQNDPDILPEPGAAVSEAIAAGKDILWNRRQIQSVALQGILQGESVLRLGKRLADTVGEKDYKAAVRNARTMATSAQNAGRIAAFERAENMGIELEKMWIATLDGRTRHSHAAIDGEVVPTKAAFSNGLQYPGDMAPGNPGEVYNCRCTTIAVLKSIGRDLSRRSEKALGGMSYEEWKAYHTAKNEVKNGRL